MCGFSGFYQGTLARPRRELGVQCGNFQIDVEILDKEKQQRN
jgi:hypothetical protein